MVTLNATDGGNRRSFSVIVRDARGNQFWRPLPVGSRMTIRELIEAAHRRFRLEAEVTWMMRDERTGRLLRDDVTIDRLRHPSHEPVELAVHPDPILG